MKLYACLCAYTLMHTDTDIEKIAHTCTQYGNINTHKYTQHMYSPKKFKHTDTLK